jgi:dephospho-CoA kinase
MNPASLQPQRIIGLTGGIATGKSTVAEILANTYGLPILDADLLARAAVAPGSAILAAIFGHFGQSLQQVDGSLNRAALGQIIFANPQERQWLEAQIHPYVRQQLRDQAANLTEQPLLVMVIPLLFEAKMTDLVTEIWVVTCPPEIEIQRLISRDRLSPADAAARIASQMPLVEKVQRADVVIDNQGSRAALAQQVAQALGAKMEGQG